MGTASAIHRRKDARRTQARPTSLPRRFQRTHDGGANAFAQPASRPAEELFFIRGAIFKDKQLKALSIIKLKSNSARKQIMQILGDSQLTDEFIEKFS